MTDVCRLIQQIVYQDLLPLRRLPAQRLIRRRHEKYLEMTRSFMKPQ